MFHDLRQAFPTPACSSHTPVRTHLRDEDLATPDDVMQMTGMSRDWVYEVFRVPAKGGIQPIKMGNARNAPLRWYTWQVKAYIAALAQAANRR